MKKIINGKIYNSNKREFLYLFKKNRIPDEFFKEISNESAKRFYKVPDRNTRELFFTFIKRNNLNLYYKKCCICGFDRRVEMCHLIPHSKNGYYTLDNILPLCPNHHKCLDRNLLFDNEYEAIQYFLWNIICTVLPFYFTASEQEMFFNNKKIKY